MPELVELLLEVIGGLIAAVVILTIWALGFLAVVILCIAVWQRTSPPARGGEIERLVPKERRS